MGFPKQEYWSELPFPTPADPNPPCSIVTSKKKKNVDMSVTIFFFFFLSFFFFFFLLFGKDIQPVHPKGDKSWVFIGRTDAEVETPVLWPPHAKN